MSFLSIGDLSASLRLRYLNTDLKQHASQLGAELASGKSSDIAKKMHGAVDRLGSITRATAMMDAYQVSATELLNKATGLQSSLDLIRDVTNRTSGQVLAAGTTPTDVSVRTASVTAADGFEAVVATLNSQLAGRSLYAGQSWDQPAVASASDMLDDLETLAAVATTAGDVIQIVDDYFNLAGGGFETSGYLGSTSSAGPVRVSDGETVELTTTASDPALRKTMQGLALGALVTRGILAADTSASASILQASGEVLLTATDAVIGVQAEIGSTESRVEVIQAGNSAQQANLNLMLGELTAIGTYKTATDLQAVETRLEALYITTSRLSQLLLVKYLR